MNNVDLKKELITAIVSAVVAVVLYFSAKYLAPSIAEDIKFVVATLEPIVLAVIALLTVQKLHGSWLRVKKVELQIPLTPYGEEQAKGKN